MSFTTTALADDRYLVEGQDVRGVTGQVIVDGTQWNQMQRRRELTEAHKEFDLKVEAFFAPLSEAISEINSAKKIEVDPLLYVVEQEAVEGSAAREERLIRLTPDSVILRAIAEGKDDRLIWVGGELVLTAEPVITRQPGHYDIPEDPVKDLLVEDLPEDPFQSGDADA